MDHRWISGGVEISQRRHRPGSVLKNAEIDALVAIQGLQVVLHIAAAIAWGGDRNHRPAGFHPGHEGGTAIGTAIGSVAGEGDGGGRTGGAEHDGVGIAVERGWSQLVGAHTSLGRLAASAGCRAAVEIHDARHLRAAAAAGAHVSHPVLHGSHAHGRRQGQGVAEASGQIHARTGLAALGAELFVGHQVVEAELLGTDRELRIARSGGQAVQHGRRQPKAQNVGSIGISRRREQQRLIKQHLLNYTAAEQHPAGDCAGIEQTDGRIINGYRVPGAGNREGYPGAEIHLAGLHSAAGVDADQQQLVAAALAGRDHADQIAEARGQIERGVGALHRHPPCQCWVELTDLQSVGLAGIAVSERQAISIGAQSQPRHKAGVEQALGPPESAQVDIGGLAGSKVYNCTGAVQGAALVDQIGLVVVLSRHHLTRSRLHPPFADRLAGAPAGAGCWRRGVGLANLTVASCDVVHRQLLDQLLARLFEHYDRFGAESGVAGAGYGCFRNLISRTPAITAWVIQ